MKVCMVVPQEDVKGGIASVVNGYREHGFENKCEVIYVESYCDGSKWKKLWKAIQGYFSFFKVLTFDKPDLVHVHSSFGPSFYRKLPFIYMASAYGLPVVNHIHGAEFDTFFEMASPRKQRLIRKVYQKCNMLIALSEEWKEKLAKIVPADKITVIENYCAIPPKIEEEKKAQILFMGEIGKRKGCFDIPRIYSCLMEEVQELPFLIMAGDGEMQEVRELFAREAPEARVVYTGWIRGEDKEKLLRESGIFLFPSYYEGMPMAVLEAMAYGLAIVTTRVGGMEQLIHDGESGYLCSPGNVEQIAGCVAELLGNEQKRKEFGEAARRRAIQEYSLEGHVEKLLKLYGKVCGSGKSRGDFYGDSN